MEEDNYMGKRLEELSMEDKRKLSEGRQSFGEKHDDSILDGAEILFRMNRQELNMENATKLVDVMEHGGISEVRISPSPFGYNVDGVDVMERDGISEAKTSPPPFGYNVDGTKLPRLPPLRQLHDIIESCSEPFVKQLTLTDISRSHNRLAFNKDDVYRSILPFLHSLNQGDKELEVGIQVTTYDPRGKTYQMVFKTWADKKLYVLNTVGWNQFVTDNDLMNSVDWVTVWMFVHKGRGNLCFALDIKRFDTPEFIKKRRKREWENV